MSFTRIPNKIIDESKLNPYQFQLFSIIVRKTDGWCKVEDGISLSQFQSMVTFGKMKIISTLKELEEMGLICKTKTFKVNGGKSFNMYKISATLVSEVDKGSISDGQGLVSEVDIQKKTNTKETKQKPYDTFISYLKAKCKYKTKVTKTKEGERLFKKLEDKKQLIVDYLKHQEEKKEYSVRITAFMEDYETVYKQQNNSNDKFGGWSE